MDAPPVAHALVWRAAGLVFEWPAGLPIAVYRQGCRDPFAEIDADREAYLPMVLQAIASRWLRDAGW
jgi:hypothetical protein